MAPSYLFLTIAVVFFYLTCGYASSDGPSSREVQPTVGDNVTLACDYTDPPTGIFWSLNGTQITPALSNGRISESPNRDALTIVNYTLADDNNYVCNLYYPNNSVVIQQVFTVAGRYGAYVNKLHSDKVNVNETARIVCNFSGFPKPDVHWSRQVVVVNDNSSMPSNITNEKIKEGGRYNIENNATHSTLVIANVVESDKGNYTCAVVNDNGRQDVPYFLNVHHVEPPASKWALIGILLGAVFVAIILIGIVVIVVTKCCRKKSVKKHLVTSERATATMTAEENAELVPPPHVTVQTTSTRLTRP